MVTICVCALASKKALQQREVESLQAKLAYERGMGRVGDAKGSTIS